MYYEIIDATDEETYYTLGGWHELEKAVVELDACKEPAETGYPYADNYEDYAKFEIRRRREGWHTTGKVVYRKTFTLHYAETTDEYVWKSTTEDLRK